MSDRLEKKLENFEWKSRSFSRHRSQLKAVLLQAGSEEKSQSSWLQRGWINIIHMSIPKKVLGGGLVVVIAAVIGIVGSGKLPAIAARLNLNIGKEYSELSTTDQKTVANDYWQKLQNYAALSKQANDLKFVGDEEVSVVPFDSTGKVVGKEEKSSLSMWKFTTTQDGQTVAIKLGYNKQNVPQYFAYDSVNSEQPQQVNKYQQEWYKKLLQDELAYSKKASDLVETPFRGERHNPTKEEIDFQMQPRLNEGEQLEYPSFTREEITSRLSMLFDVYYKNTSDNKEEKFQFPLEGATNLNDLAEGKILHFTLPNGRKEMLVVGKSGTPYYAMTIKSSPFETTLRKFHQALDQKGIKDYYASSVNSDPQHIVVVFMPERLLTKSINELFKDPNYVNDNPSADPTYNYRPTKLPDNVHNVIVDAYGLPQDLLDQLKKDIPDLLVMKINP